MQLYNDILYIVKTYIIYILNNSTSLGMIPLSILTIIEDVRWMGVS
jgi:hypothetical protein